MGGYQRESGGAVGVKPAGGIGTAKQAVQYLVLLYETLGPDWMTPERFRLRASSLLNDCLMQLAREKSGAYQSGDYFTIDYRSPSPRPPRPAPPPPPPPTTPPPRRPTPSPT